jgi:hypothetical protein
MKIENDVRGWKSILSVVVMLSIYSYYMIDGIDLILYYPLYYPDVKMLALMDFSLAMLWAGILNIYLDMKKNASAKAELLAALMDASNTIGICLDMPGPKTPIDFAECDRFVRKQLDAINKVIIKYAYKRKKKS